MFSRSARGATCVTRVQSACSRVIVAPSDQVALAVAARSCLRAASMARWRASRFASELPRWSSIACAGARYGVRAQLSWPPGSLAHVFVPPSMSVNREGDCPRGRPGHGDVPIERRGSPRFQVGHGRLALRSARDGQQASSVCRRTFNAESLPPAGDLQAIDDGGDGGSAGRRGHPGLGPAPGAASTMLLKLGVHEGRGRRARGRRPPSPRSPTPPRSTSPVRMGWQVRWKCVRRGHVSFSS